MSDNIFGDVIFSYSRAQAVEDGVLVDLSTLCPEEAKLYKHNVCCTAAVWAIIDQAVNNKKHHNDLKGVVWDLMFMSTRARVNRAGSDASTCYFQCIIKGAGRKSLFTFKLVCGPGDSAEPVITIMLPDED